MPKAADRVPVSERAVVQRINRKLAARGKKLKKCRGAYWREKLGEYYILHVAHDCIDDSHVSLEALGRELKVLGAWEKVAGE